MCQLPLLRAARSCRLCMAQALLSTVVAKILLVYVAHWLCSLLALSCACHCCSYLACEMAGHYVRRCMWQCKHTTHNAQPLAASPHCLPTNRLLFGQLLQGELCARQPLHVILASTHTSMRIAQHSSCYTFQQHPSSSHCLPPLHTCDLFCVWKFTAGRALLAQATPRNSCRNPAHRLLLSSHCLPLLPACPIFKHWRSTTTGRALCAQATTRHPCRNPAYRLLPFRPHPIQTRNKPATALGGPGQQGRARQGSL
jgi:hypothetical protein